MKSLKLLKSNQFNNYFTPIWDECSWNYPIKNTFRALFPLDITLKLPTLLQCAILVIIIIETKHSFILPKIIGNYEFYRNSKLCADFFKHDSSLASKFSIGFFKAKLKISTRMPRVAKNLLTHHQSIVCVHFNLFWLRLLLLVCPKIGGELKALLKNCHIRMHISQNFLTNIYEYKMNLDFKWENINSPKSFWF